MDLQTSKTAAKGLFAADDWKLVPSKESKSSPQASKQASKQTQVVDTTDMQIIYLLIVQYVVEMDIQLTSDTFEFVGHATTTLDLVFIHLPNVFQPAIQQETQLVCVDNNTLTCTLHDAERHRLLDFPKLKHSNKTEVDEIYFIRFQSMEHLEEACTAITRNGHIFGDPDAKQRVRITRLRKAQTKRVPNIRSIHPSNCFNNCGKICFCSRLCSWKNKYEDNSPCRFSKGEICSCNFCINFNNRLGWSWKNKYEDNRPCRFSKGEICSCSSCTNFTNRLGWNF
jgi:hypothetical protein